MNDNRIINLKIYESDFIMVQAIVLEHIRKLKNDLQSEHLTDEAKKIIEKTICDDKTLIEKLNLCKLYDEK